MRLGRVRGITIDIHMSWIVIFALVTYSLGAGYFRVTFPEWGGGVLWSVSLLSAVLFFACVVLHELGHSLTAQKHGISVHGITLFLFGGVARMDREPETPQVEMRVALAGPLVSVLLALGFGALGWAFGGLGGKHPVAMVSLYLALVNGMVVIFNMVPGFPLDGGRALRAALWWYTGSVARATRLAAASGKGFGAFLIASGILLAFAGNLFNGTWFVLVGWFLADAAGTAYAQTLSQHALSGTPLSEVVPWPDEGVTGETSIQTLVDTRLGYNSPDPVPVIENGRVQGLVGIPEVKRIAQTEWTSTTAREAMVPVAALGTVSSDRDAWETLVRMSDQNLEWLAVVDDGEFRGVISPRRLLEYARRRRLAAT